MEEKIIAIKPDASRLLNKISKFLAGKDIPAFIVGGFVRDMLLGRSTDDIDIAVAADALKTASEVAGLLNGKFVLLDEVNPTGRVILPDGKWQVDFTTFKGDIREDLGRRDFTIDAMAIELGRDFKDRFNTKEIIDPFGGQSDIDSKTLRAVNDNVFRDDAVRLLRAVRLAAELDFDIDSHTEELIKRDNHLIGGVAGERVREELLRLLALHGAGQRISYLDKLGILTALIPELLPSKGVEQPIVHAWDVFEHSIQTVSALEFILRESTWEYADEKVLSYIPWSEKLRELLDREISHGSTARTMLKLAALFHDLGKPQTKTIDDGKTRFLGHPEEGAVTTSAVMERLRFSKKETAMVTLLVKYHMRPTQMSHEGLPTDRAIYRFFQDTGEAGIDLLYLCLADHLAARADTLDINEWREHCRMTEYVIKKYLEEEKVSAPPKILDGHDIMKILNLEPGPEVGKVLEELREAQAAGEITSREQAVAFIKQLLPKME